MLSPPETRVSLILRLQDGQDTAAWDEFARLYGPVVYRSARRLGLQSADADDCVQEVLTAVADSVANWLQREDRGAFRAWLFRIARNTAIDFLTRRRHRPWATGGDCVGQRIEQLETDREVSSRFDIEYRREMFLRASELVRGKVSESTWQAFYRTSVVEEAVAEVANQLKMSIGSVYIARSRVMKRLQEAVRSLEDSSHAEL